MGDFPMISLKKSDIAPGKLHWQKVDGDSPFTTWRTELPGGWLVVMITGPASTTVTFYPDPTHAWDGSSAEKTQQA
jgi:hypothetical protein